MKRGRFDGASARRLAASRALRAVRALCALALCCGLASQQAGCGAPRATRTAAAAAKYHCPMHPAVVSDRPGTCPICAMDLVPVERQSGRQDAAGSAPAIRGLAAVEITPEVRQRMGLTLGRVGKRAMAREVRTSARIVPDETRLYHVNTKVDGWVEKLFVATTGQSVRKGDPLLSIYSPELVAAQQELLSAAQSAVPGLEAAARRRLALWDVSQEQVERLMRTGQVERTLTLYAPVSGTLLERRISAGHRAAAGEDLMTLADLSAMWADADIYQSDIAHVRVGMDAELSLPYWPEKRFAGKVTFLSAALDPESLTMRARLEVPNPDGLLKPGMFGVAVLRYALGERLAVPLAAVLHDGERAYAFRDAGEGRLAPVEIRLGVRCGDWVELIDGLKDGDAVVTSAAFLVDSESSMRAALEAIGAGGR